MDVRKLNAKQLADLANKIEKRQQALKAAQTGEARAEINAILQKYELRLDQVFVPRAPKAAAAPAAATKPAAAAKPEAAAKPAAGKAKKGGRGGKRKGIRKGLKPKFANPNNPKETWVGIGKRPFWYNAALAAGKKDKDMLI